MSGAALLALGAAFCFALALILTQFGLRTMPSWRSPLYSIIGSAVVAWLLALPLVDWAALDWRAVAIFAGVGCIFPVVVSILSVRSNEKLGPAVAGAVGNVTPLFAVLGAVLFLGERLLFAQLAGLAMVVGGVALLALRGGAGGRQWSVWVLGLPLAAALVRGSIQPAIKVGLAIWHEPLAAAAIGYTLSSIVILLLVVVPYGKDRRFAKVFFGFCVSASPMAQRPFFFTRRWDSARSPWWRRWSRYSRSSQSC